LHTGGGAQGDHCIQGVADGLGPPLIPAQAAASTTAEHPQHLQRLPIAQTGRGITT
jgi:hypothetical protein